MEEKYTVQTCSVCKNLKRDEIENELMTRARSQKDIAKSYGISEASLSNHKNKHMLLNMRERLKIIIQKSIMDGLEPDNVGELIRLIEYVERMDNENFLDAKQEWSSAFEEKYKAFEHLILDTLYFSTISKPLRRGLLVTAKHCFMHDPPRDVGVWMSDMLEALKEIPGDTEEDV